LQPKKSYQNKSKRYFTPFEYVNFASNIIKGKKRRLNNLQQLLPNHSQLTQEDFQTKSLKQIINETEQILKKSYSVKILGED